MPYDLTIHEKTLRRDALRKLDFAKHDDLLTNDKIEKTLKRAMKVGENGFANLKLKKGNFAGKPTYKIENFSDELVLRIIGKGIQRLTGVRQSNRLAIAKAMKCLLEDGGEYSIFKLDIKSFYENIDTQKILLDLEADMSFSRSCLKTLETFFAQTIANGIRGLPRGVALSAILSEYYVRRFDYEVSSNGNVFYYSRFVDDIFIITKPQENIQEFLNVIAASLPKSLKFNTKKTRTYSFNEAILKKSTPAAIHARFDFLGYQFEVHQRQKSDNGVHRKLRIDISQSKTNKLKTKVIKAFLRFRDDNNFDDLFNRLKLLTGNYVIYDQARGVRRKAGIFYNYNMITKGASQSLDELDSFLRRFILNSNGKLGMALHASLSKAQRRKLLKISFKRGFEKRDFHHFSAVALVRLLGCWKYA